MRMTPKKTILILMEILIIIINILIFTIYDESNSIPFNSLCQYGSIYVVFLSISLCVFQKKIISEINLLFFSFWLFQFGIPMLFSISNKYNNFYITLFDEIILLSATKFTIIALGIMALGLKIGLLIRRDRICFLYGENSWGNFFDKNRDLVARGSVILFACSAILILPITGMAVMKQIASGVYSIAYRGIMSDNFILKFAQEFFYSSALLYIIFEKKRKNIIAIVLLYIIAACFMLILADRAKGLVAIFILIYYHYVVNSKENTKNNIKFILTGAVLSMALVFIAEARTGNTSLDSILGIKLLENILSEFGFNFTSICFVMDYIPRYFPYSMGDTYIASFIKLIPSTLDFFGLLSNEKFILGESWLYQANQIYRGDFLNFGVGFSLIAESYMNFSWYGLIIIFIIGILVACFLEPQKSNRWYQYIKIVMLLNIIMLPRRQIFTLIKAWEYSIIFLGIYIFLFIKLAKSNRGEKIDESSNDF